jgi:hypothetical protein
MTKVSLGFDLEPLSVSVDRILPSRKTPVGVLTSRKYIQIRSSIQEVGLIEPLSVRPADLQTGQHILLDGHIRLMALQELKFGEVSSLVEEMESRYRKFAAARARDLPTYNSKATSEERLPMVFLIHDEFADWMLDDEYKSSVSAAVQRLGVKARAAGIHLIFAAQRPDKDVMPMQLRENLGNRLILKVASEATSKIALDRSGAELLLGRGHMAAKLNGEQGLVFAQAPFLSDQDIEMAVAAIRSDNSIQ